MGYQWQLKYRWKPTFEYSLQGLGNVGPWTQWTSWAEQQHVAGLAVFGRIKAGDRQTIKCNAGLLFGLTDVSPRNTLRVHAEYEF